MIICILCLFPNMIKSHHFLMIGSHFVVQAYLELTMQPMLVSNHVDPPASAFKSCMVISFYQSLEYKRRKGQMKSWCSIVCHSWSLRGVHSWKWERNTERRRGRSLLFCLSWGETLYPAVSLIFMVGDGVEGPRKPIFLSLPPLLLFVLLLLLFLFLLSLSFLFLFSG